VSVSHSSTIRPGRSICGRSAAPPALQPGQGGGQVRAGGEADEVGDAGYGIEGDWSARRQEGGQAEILFSLRNENDKALFWKSSLFFLGLWIAATAAHFPNIIKGIDAPHLSITIYNGSTTLYTLQVMSIIALIGMPIVIAYTIFVYRIFKGKAQARHY